MAKKVILAIINCVRLKCFRQCGESIRRAIALGIINAAVYFDKAFKPMTSPNIIAHFLLPVSRHITRQTMLNAQRGICI